MEAVVAGVLHREKTCHFPSKRFQVLWGKKKSFDGEGLVGHFSRFFNHHYFLSENSTDCLMFYM